MITTKLLLTKGAFVPNEAVFVYIKFDKLSVGAFVVGKPVMKVDLDFC